MKQLLIICALIFVFPTFAMAQQISISTVQPKPTQKNSSSQKNQSNVSATPLPQAAIQPNIIVNSSPAPVDPNSTYAMLINGTAALFAVFSAAFAVAVAYAAFKGLGQLNNLLERVESHGTSKVDTRIDEMMKGEVETKVKNSIATQLKEAIEAGQQQMKDEIRLSIDRDDLKEMLVKNVAAELHKMQNRPLA